MEDVVATSSTSQAGDKADNSEMMEYKVFENAKTQLENWVYVSFYRSFILLHKFKNIY